MKRFLCTIFVAALLFCLSSALAGDAGTAADPLISLSFIDETLIPKMNEAGSAAVTAAVDEAYASAVSDAQAEYDDALLRYGGPAGYVLLDSSSTVNMPAGGSLSLVTGSSFTSVSGEVTADIVSGCVLNVTTGEEIPGGSVLTVGNRYICCEGTKVALTASSDAFLLADGYIKPSNGTVADNSGSSNTPEPGYVVLSKQTILFNGNPVSMEVYNISDSNYFKLRDIAMMMNGTGSQFSIDFDSSAFALYAKTGGKYTAIGGEMEPGEDKSSTCVVSSWSFNVDGVRRPVWIYNLGGNNFFKLRDLGSALGFYVGYDEASNTVIIESSDNG